MANKKGKSKRSKKRKAVVALTVAAPIALIGLNAYGQYKNGGWESVRKNTVMAAAFKGEDDKLDIMRGAQFYAPILVGAGAAYVASKLNVNKKIARSGIPLIRL